MWHCVRLVGIIASLKWSPYWPNHQVRGKVGRHTDPRPAINYLKSQVISSPQSYLVDCFSVFKIHIPGCPSSAGQPGTDQPHLKKTRLLCPLLIWKPTFDTSGSVYKIVYWEVEKSPIIHVFFQEQSIIGNLNIAPAVNWAGKNSKDYTNLFLEVSSSGRWKVFCFCQCCHGCLKWYPEEI